jgi:hypothetical protein
MPQVWVGEHEAAGRMPHSEERSRMNGFIIRAVVGRLGVLLVCALVVAFAVSCGGGGNEAPKETPTPAPGGLDLPADLSTDQKDAILHIKNLADETTPPLATFVSQRPLSEDEVRATIEGDAQFANLEKLAKNAGFGLATAGIELQYDNDIKVTAAVLDSPEGGLALAMRETGATPVYIVVHLSSDGRTITEYNSEGTITLDTETLKGSEVDTPDAHHSCRTGHCIWAALTWLYDSWYGFIVEKICRACMDAVAAEIVTAGASTVITIPSCIACIPGLAAAGIASAIVCYDAPCSYCTDNSCGDPPMAHEEYCAWQVGPRDPVTGISASVTGANTGYQCVGIKQKTFGGEDYSETECQYSSESTGIVRSCPYGCADVAPGDTASRDCAELSTCDPAACNSEEEKGDPYCVPMPAPDRDVIKRDYEIRECVPTANGGSTCQPRTEAREIAECALGCAPDGEHCLAQATPRVTPRITPEATPSPGSTACDPATCNGKRAVGDPVCTLDPGGRTGRVTQQYERCACQAVELEPGQSSCECAPAPSEVTVCSAGCAADGKSCGGRK